MFFSQMCRYIDITRDEYFEEMKRYEEDIKSFNLLLNQSKILKYKMHTSLQLQLSFSKSPSSNLFYTINIATETRANTFTTTSRTSPRNSSNR